MSVSQQRFTDAREFLIDFMDEYSVVCPRCEKCAKVSVLDAKEPPLFAPRRLTCIHCGYVAESHERSVSSRFNDVSRDWYFDRPFYYRKPSCGHELWVLNQKHLEFLRDFVGAQLRSRSPNERGWSNRSLASRLPKWISAAAHREEILASLDKIEKMMEVQK